MSIFGRTDRDLHLLRLPPAEMNLVEFSELQKQLNHHCVRLAWRQHARTGSPVRDVLRAVAGTAYIRLNDVAPNDEFDEELLSIHIEDAERENIRACLGFLLSDESHALCRAAVEGPFPPPHSIFEDHHFLLLVPHLPEKPSRLLGVRAALLALKGLWAACRHAVATDPLARETARLVTGATGKHPGALEDFFLNARLSMIESFIAEFEPR